MFKCLDFFNFAWFKCLDFFNLFFILLIMGYLTRLIDEYLLSWANSDSHKPVLLRGARQVGKSWAVRNLGKTFRYFVEINFERNPEYKSIFTQNLDVERIVSQLGILVKKPIVEGETLLFFDEIQECPEAIMSLRFFREDKPQLHVIGAGSLLEFTLADLPTFGVGRIHSMFMYPMSFDEFLTACGESMLIEARNAASPDTPLPVILHDKCVELFRIFLLVGGMPEVVSKWIETHDYLKCHEILNDLLVSYEDDFSKYKKKANPELLRQVLRSAALQLTKKFTYSNVPGNHSTYEVKNAVDLLCMAGLLLPVKRTDANGLPLGSESNDAYTKILLLDTGLTLRLLGLAEDTYQLLTRDIMTQTATDLVNKGPMAELAAGLELIRYKSPELRHYLYYWTRQEKNSLAEIDYLGSQDGKVLPIEIKAGTKGGMKSLWFFMRAKNLVQAVRSSLENFGRFDYEDPLESGTIRKVTICPLYAISQMKRLLSL